MDRFLMTGRAGGARHGGGELVLEIIDTVLEAEARAARLVADAERAAAALETAAVDEETRRIRDARRDADARVRRELAAVREEQTRRTAHAAEQADRTGDVIPEETATRLAEAVQEAVAVVLYGPGRSRGET